LFDRNAPISKVGLAIVFLLAFAVRVGVTAKFQGLTAPPKAEANPDQVEYEGFAYHLSTGQGYCLTPGEPSACRAPGTSLTLLPVYLIFGRSFLAARLWWCALSALTCVAAAWLAARCFDNGTAIPAGIWLALYPGHFYYVMHFLSETPATLFMTLATGFSVAALRGGRTRDDVLAALFWGLAALTRPNLILAAPLAPLARLLFFRTEFRRDFAALVLQGAVVTAVVGPWLARNAMIIGKPTFCTIVGGFTFWGAHNERVYDDLSLRGCWIRCGDLVDADHPLPQDEVGKDAAAWRYGMDFVRSHTEEMPALVAWKLYRFVGPPAEVNNGSVYKAFLLGWLITAPFALLGFVLSWRHSTAAATALVIPVLVTIATVIVFYGSERFRDGIAPIIVVYAAGGATGLARAVFGGPRPSSARESASPPDAADRRPGTAVVVALVGLVLIVVGAALVAPDVRVAAQGRGSGDFERQWLVAQYVRAGINPFAVCVVVIRHALELNDPHFTGRKMTNMEVPGWQDVEGVLPGYLPPETTYSPPCILALRYTFGLLTREAARLLWTALNLVLLAWLAIWLAREAMPADPRMAIPTALLAVGLILVWPPVRSVFYSSQFTFLEMTCVLMGLRESDRSTGRASFWFALALLKPAFALVFLIYPVIRRRYAVPFLAGAVHLAALPVIAYLVNSSPVDVVRQWVEASAHFLGGMYTLQDVMTRLGPGHGLVGASLQAGFVGAVFVWCWYNRTAPVEPLIDFLCFANLLWMYHGDFDFALLLLPVMHSCRRLLDRTAESKVRWIAAGELLCFALIGVGMLRSVYIGSADGSEDQLLRLARWGCRLALFGMLGWHAIRLGRARTESRVVPAVALA
jgi:4-amino-4-deoxy-L-arabinose transferase-like glycosyltransferase